MRRWLLPVFLAVLLALDGEAQHALADEPTQNREFAWGVLAFTGQEYEGVFSPGEVPRLSLLAEYTHVLTAHYTEVYYWPIDREYKPDWATLNEEVDGALEVLDANGQVIQTLQREMYLVTNADYSLGSMTRLFRGAEATALYEEYVAEREASFASWAEYDRLFKDYLEATKSGNPDLQPPSEPPMFTESLAPPRQGFLLSVQPGTYHIQLRDDAGRVVADSQRTVTGMTPRREGVGYSVIPETKWTVPERSDERHHALYCSADGTRVFLEPFATQEYNYRAYVRMRKPQDTIASPNRWVWVYTSPLEAAYLEVWSASQLIAQIPKKPYVVEQLPGPGLGYQVVPFDEDLHVKPSFEAFEVPVDPGVAGYTVRLLRMDGTVILGSERRIVLASKELPNLAYGLALLPLIIPLGIRWSRRRNQAHSSANV